MASKTGDNAMSNFEQEVLKLDQSSRIARMREEVERQGGVITSYETVPAHIEEELLKQTLRFESRGIKDVY